MSQVLVTVGWVKKGSMNAVVGSGTTSMSLSSMDWKPRMEGAVEAGALGEELLVELHQGHGEVLPGADQVAEAEVDHPGAALLDHLHDVRYSLGPVVTACHRTAPCDSYAAAGGRPVVTG